MHMRFRTSQAILQMLVSCRLLKFACQAALLPSALLDVWPQKKPIKILNLLLLMSLGF